MWKDSFWLNTKATLFPGSRAADSSGVQDGVRAPGGQRGAAELQGPALLASSD